MLGLEADAVEIEADVAAVEHANDAAFAEHGGQDADAHIDGVAADVQFDTAILRQAAFGDVEVGHDLDTGGDGHGEMARRRHHFIENAVAAVAHLVFIFEGLEMNIAGPVLDGQEHDHVEQLADGSGVLNFHEAFKVDAAFPAVRPFLAVLEGGDDVHDRFFLADVALRKHFSDGRGVGQGGDDFLDLQEVAQVVEGGQVAGIAEDHRERIILEGEGQDLVDAGHGFGDAGQRFRAGLELFRTEQSEPELIGESLLQLHRGDEAARQRRLAHEDAGTFSFFKDGPELIFIEIAKIDKDLAQTTTGAAAAARFDGSRLMVLGGDSRLAGGLGRGGRRGLGRCLTWRGFGSGCLTLDRLGARDGWLGYRCCRYAGLGAGRARNAGLGGHGASGGLGRGRDRRLGAGLRRGPGRLPRGLLRSGWLASAGGGRWLGGAWRHGRLAGPRLLWIIRCGHGAYLSGTLGLVRFRWNRT